MAADFVIVVFILSVCCVAVFVPPYALSVTREQRARQSIAVAIY
jgi:hypothetical protein